MIHCLKYVRKMSYLISILEIVQNMIFFLSYCFFSFKSQNFFLIIISRFKIPDYCCFEMLDPTVNVNTVYFILITVVFVFFWSGGGNRCGHGFF